MIYLTAREIKAAAERLKDSDLDQPIIIEVDERKVCIKDFDHQILAYLPRSLTMSAAS